MLSKISVITVVYNAVQTIENTILSVLHQTYPNIEYIVIDGASTDGTVDVIKKYSDRLTWFSEPDKGLYDAMNKGIQKATGDWINFLNSGDEFFSKSTLSDIFETCHLDGDILYGDIVAKYGHNKYRNVSTKPLEYFCKGMPFCHQSAFVKAHILKNRNFDLSYRVFADYDMFYEFYYKKCYRFQKLPGFHAVYSVGGVSGITAPIEEMKRINGQNISKWLFFKNRLGRKLPLKVFFFLCQLKHIGRIYTIDKEQ